MKFIYYGLAFVLIQNTPIYASGKLRVKVAPFEVRFRYETDDFKIESPELKLLCEALEIAGDSRSAGSRHRSVELAIPARFQNSSGVLHIINDATLELENPFHSVEMTHQTCAIQLSFNLADPEDKDFFVSIYGLKFHSSLEKPEITSTFVSDLNQSMLILEPEGDMWIPYFVPPGRRKYQVGYSFRDTPKKRDELFPL